MERAIGSGHKLCSGKGCDCRRDGSLGGVLTIDMEGGGYSVGDADDPDNAGGATLRHSFAAKARTAIAAA